MFLIQSELPYRRNGCFDLFQSFHYDTMCCRDIHSHESIAAWSKGRTFVHSNPCFCDKKVLKLLSGHSELPAIEPDHISGFRLKSYDFGYHFPAIILYKFNIMINIIK